MTNLEEKIKKLPKWAQHEFARLRADLARAQDFVSGEGPVEVGAYGPQPVRYPARTTVKFHIGDGYIDVDLREDRIMVRGSTQITLGPSASNGVDVSIY